MVYQTKHLQSLEFKKVCQLLIQTINELKCIEYTILKWDKWYIKNWTDAL